MKIKFRKLNLAHRLHRSDCQLSARDYFSPLPSLNQYYSQLQPDWPLYFIFSLTYYVQKFCLVYHYLFLHCFSSLHFMCCWTENPNPSSIQREKGKGEADSRSYLNDKENNLLNEGNNILDDFPCFSQLTIRHSFIQILRETQNFVFVLWFSK